MINSCHFSLKQMLPCVSWWKLYSTWYWNQRFSKVEITSESVLSGLEGHMHILMHTLITTTSITMHIGIFPIEKALLTK